MAVSKEHCRIIEKVGAFADAQWVEHGRFIAGDIGYDAMRYQSVKMSHPPFPIFMYSLGNMPVLSNGMTVNLWGSKDPLCLPVLNINHSQTRKSRLTSYSEGLVAHVDRHCVKRMEYIYEAKQKVQEHASKKRRIAEAADTPAAPEGIPPANEDADTKTTPFPGIWSLAFLGGTIERVRERCAGDFCIVKQTKGLQKLPCLDPGYVQREMKDLNEAEKAIAFQFGMRGRPWFGNGLVYDEIYQLLQDLSILDKPTDKKGGDANFAGQTPLAGWFNKLVQRGKSDHETKSCGSHGGLECPPVSTSILGNFHVTPAIEMIRGERGDHGCQAKARLLVATGLPVQPHQYLDSCDDLDVKLLWVDIPKLILETLGLEEAVKSTHAFKEFFESDAADDDEGGELAAFIPDEIGFQHELPDQVEVNVRMMLVDGRYKPQWCLPDRDIKIPDDKDINKQMPEFIEFCGGIAHRALDLDTTAKGTFLSYATYYNILVKKSRDDMDADTGAENGIGPWKLGMLAGALLLWDILWKKVVVAYREEKLYIKTEHVERSFRLLLIQDGIKNAFRTFEVPAGVSASTSADRNFTEIEATGAVKHTEIVRRLLGKASRGEAAGAYEVHSKLIWKVFGKKDRIATKVSVFLFRQLAGKCPECIGTFNNAKDLLEITVPENPDEAYDAALLEYANMSLQSLKQEFSKVVQRGGARCKKPA
jgi:hypothetical protein